MRRILGRLLHQCVADAFGAWHNRVFLQTHLTKSTRIFADRACLVKIRRAFAAWELTFSQRTVGRAKAVKHIKELDMALCGIVMRDWGRLSKAYGRARRAAEAVRQRRDMVLINLAWREFVRGVKADLYDKKVTNIMGNILTFDAFKRFVRAWKEAVRYLKGRNSALTVGMKATHKRLENRAMRALQSCYMDGLGVNNGKGRAELDLGWRVGFKIIVAWQGWVKKTQANGTKRRRNQEMERLGRRRLKRKTLHAWGGGSEVNKQRRASTISIWTFQSKVHLASPP